MSKLLALLGVIMVTGCASLDMNTLQCRNMPITNQTTLKQVQNTCLISNQTHRSGLYEVQFRNDTTQKSVKCDFATNSPDALVNGCR